MFAPQMGIAEDPATGSACGPLGAYLLHHGLVDTPTADHLIAEQGFEIKRPSVIHIHLETEGDTIARVTVGGYSQAVGAGVLYVPEE
jgi:trans-2,3-dihydro-3-hydroxyanthranilate isomerase